MKTTQTILFALAALASDSCLAFAPSSGRTVLGQSPTQVHAEANSPFAFLENILKPKEAPVAQKNTFEPVTINNDFRVAAAFLAGGLLLDQIPYIQLTLGQLVTLLGVLFLVQSFRIRFVFNAKMNWNWSMSRTFWRGKRNLREKIPLCEEPMSGPAIPLSIMISSHALAAVRWDPFWCISKRHKRIPNSGTMGQGNWPIRKKR